MLVNRLAVAFAAAAAMFTPTAALAEDGYDLWLRYAPLEGQAKAALERFDPHLERAAPDADPMIAAAVQELDRGLSSLLGQPVPQDGDPNVLLDCDSAVAIQQHIRIAILRHRLAQQRGQPAIEFLNCCSDHRIGVGRGPLQVRIEPFERSLRLPLKRGIAQPQIISVLRQRGGWREHRGSGGKRHGKPVDKHPLSHHGSATTKPRAVKSRSWGERIQCLPACAPS